MNLFKNSNKPAQSLFHNAGIGLCYLLALMTLSCGWSSLARLQGQVTLDGQDNHEGIEVYILGTQFRAITDSEGNFSFAGLEPGEYTLMAEEEGYDSARQEITLSGGSNTLEPIVLEQTYIPAGSLSGFITLPEQENHQGISVMLTGTSHSTKTNSSGHFLMQDITPGTYTLMAVKPGWLMHMIEDITIEDGQETQIGEVQLQSVESIAQNVSRQQASKPRYAIRGVALLQGKSNHQGIEVFLEDDPNISTTTDQTGNFELILFEQNPVNVIFSHEGFLDQAWQDITPAPEDSSRRFGIITLKTESTNEENRGLLRGTVLLSGEASHANTVVSLDGISQRVVTDNEGSYMIIGVQPGTYTLTAEHPGYETGRLINVQIASDQITQATTITLKKNQEDTTETGSISGTAFLQGSEDHGGIMVALEGTSFNNVTGSEGAYAFENVPTGTYTLLFSKGGYKNQYLQSIRVVTGEQTNLQPVILEQDIEPPRVIETFPRPNARDVPIVRHVDVLVRFSERMLGQSVKQSLIVEPPVTHDVFFDRESEMSDMDVLHVRLYQNGPNPVQFNTQYSFTIMPQAQTPRGVNMENPFSFRFTTDGPLIIGTMPVQNEDEFLGGTPENPIIIDTNVPVDPATVERAIRFRPRTDSIPLFEYIQHEAGGRIIVKTTLRFGTRYTMQIDNTLRSINGLRFSNTPYTLRFRTQSLNQRNRLPARR